MKIGVFDVKFIDFDVKSIDFDGKSIDFDGKSIDFDGKSVEIVDSDFENRRFGAEIHCPIFISRFLTLVYIPFFMHFPIKIAKKIAIKYIHLLFFLLVFFIVFPRVPPSCRFLTPTRKFFWRAFLWIFGRKSLFY
jgi:hypothetical protein